jgi:TPR repeat protein
LQYYSGEGVPKDFAEAARWYRKAADQGNTNGELLLGMLYSGGQGVSRDLSEAIRWKRMAADQGLPLAQQELGYLYSVGQGVPRDNVLAYMWTTLASHGMDIGSSRNELAAKMTPQEIAEGERRAAEWKPSGK